MADYYKLKVEPMTEETFGPYGTLMDAKEQPKKPPNVLPHRFSGGRHDDSQRHWQPQQGIRFTQLERHFGVTQGFVQMSGTPAVVCAAAPTDSNDPQAIPEPDQIHAFLINPETGYTFHRGTWHSLDQFLLAPPGGSFLIFNTAPNPTQIVDYQDNSSVMHPDLETQEHPVTVELKQPYGIAFELTFNWFASFKQREAPHSLGCEQGQDKLTQPDFWLLDGSRRRCQLIGQYRHDCMVLFEDRCACL